jgi:hypothetical protein
MFRNLLIVSTLLLVAACTEPMGGMGMCHSSCCNAGQHRCCTDKQCSDMQDCCKGSGGMCPMKDKK